MKKLPILLLLLFVMLFAAACGEVPDTSDQTPVETTEKKEEAPVITQGKLTLAGKPIEDYTIVYAESEYAKLRPRLQGTEYDFYRLTAEKLRDGLKALTGVTLPVALDTKTDKGENEILVGPTNRDASAFLDDLDIYEYANRVTGGALVVGGGRKLYPHTGNLRNYYSYAATYHAFDPLLTKLEEELGKGDFDLTEGFDLSGERHFTTIGCVGDSITEGVGSSDSNFCSYPAVLQRILWQDHIVVNFGNSGKTMRNDLGSNYTGTTQYNALIRMMKKIDITLVMLGTNDSYFDRYWNEEDDGKYNTAAELLFKRLRGANADMKLVVMNCPVYYGNEGSGSPHVRNLQAKLPEYLGEKGVSDVMFFNMNGYTAEKLGKACFPDLLHPNDKGYGIMARGLAEVMPEFLSGKWDYTPELVEEPSGKAPDVAIPEGAVNILGGDLETQYPLEKGRYLSWFFGGAPYVFTDLDAFWGYTVTNIEFPVTQAEKGNSFTVRVVKYAHPTVTETLATYTLTADFSCGTDWVSFGGLSIEVPKGYTLAFGKNGDTLPVLHLDAATPGYGFYGSGGNSINTTTLAFKLYGFKTGGGAEEDTPDKDITEGAKNLLPYELDESFAIEGFYDWQYGGAPYFYSDMTLFSGKTVTDIEVPVGYTPAGGRMTLSVVKCEGNRIVETLQTVTLTSKEALSNTWLLFKGLDLTVPEGYTLAFGSSNDTLKLKYLPSPISEYFFYSNGGGMTTDASLAFNIYGK